MKLRLAAGQQHNLDPALLPLEQHWPFHLRLPPIASGVLHLQRARALDLESIVEVNSGCQAVGPKAGARIVDLEKLNCCAGPVLDRGLDVI